MKDTETHVEHYPEDNPCNRCTNLTCRNQSLSYFRQCIQWQRWFSRRWMGYQIVAEKIKTSR